MKLSRKFRVGFIFVVTIILLYWGLNYLKGSKIFTKERKFYAVYNRVDGLVKANPVSVNGLKIGQVNDLHFSSDGSCKIVVEFIISNDIPIPDNSVAKIYSSDLMGSKAVNLIFGDSPQIAHSGDTLKTAIEGSIKDEVNKQVLPLKKKAENLLLSIDTMVAVVQSIFNENARKNLARSFENIKYTVDYLKSTTYNIDTLVSTQKNRMAVIILNLESITSNIKNNKRKINNIINNFSRLSDTLAQVNIANTLRNTNNTLIGISSVVDKIHNGEGTLGMLINNDTLYNQLQVSSAQLNMLIEDIKLNPQRYVHFSVFPRSAKRNKYVPPKKEVIDKK